MKSVDLNDNFFDKIFSSVTTLLVTISFKTTKTAKKAFNYYRIGLSAQSQGKYSTALKNYYQALRLEHDAYDRSFILYNIGLLYNDMGEDDQALDYYYQALEINPNLAQALYNIGIIYYNRGEKILTSYDRPDLAEILYKKAENYWKLLVDITPSNYLMVEKWLKMRANK